jgi:serine/threonine protein kinase/tetratricopeptide (TPR) repeat protein
MTPERWKQIEQLVQKALECGPAERAAFLDQTCDGDPEMRLEVESLIAAAEPAQSFLASDALENATLLLEETGSESLIGSRIGPYLIQQQLGTGGMGEVYLAQDVRLRRQIALKLLDHSLMGDSRSHQRFLREARMASALDHPNICTIHEVGEEAGRPFIAMQLVEGVTLMQAINGKPMSLDSLLGLSLQIADALSAAHARGIIHRDIKAGNIMVTPNGKAKVLDFGLAKPLDRTEDETHHADLTMTGLVIGTPGSMSPEQARGEHVDHRSDIFSFGVVMYQMATGSTPFAGRSKVDVLTAVLSQTQTPAAELNQDIPQRFSALIDRALAKEPDARYQTMDELISDLKDIVDEMDSSNRHTRPLGRQSSPHSRQQHGVVGRWIQSRTAVGLFVLIAVLLSGLALALYYSSGGGRAPSVTPIKSIAVLPFKPLVANTRDEVLELGMADTLISKLSNIKQVTVRPLTAVRKYTKLDQDATAAGREQNVDAVLDGNIQRSGEKVRVTVRLVRVADGHEIWSEQFDESFTDIFAVQDSVSRKVTGVLAVALTGDEDKLLTKRQTSNVEAYQLYGLGRYHLTRLTDDGFRKGRDYFQQAINKDPNYALAYAGLADANNRLSGWNAVAPKEGFPAAKKAALKALEIDEGLAEAHTQLGVTKLLYDWDWVGAENEFKRAVEINPNNPDTRYLYGLHLSAMGRFEEAVTEMKRAQELEPISLEKIAGIGDTRYYQRHFDEAIAQYQKALEMDQNSGYAHWALGNVYLHKGMLEQAIAEYQKSIPLSGDSPDEPASLAYVYAISGKTQEARQILGDLQQRAKRSYVAPTMIASVYAALGEKDQAFAWLDKAYEERDFILIFLKVDPTFDRLRSDPRFPTLMQRIGLPP